MEQISPLFAVDAQKLLQSGNYEAAIELCRNGLEHYPDYLSAKQILAKALKLTGLEDEANITISSVSNFSKAANLIKFNYENHDVFSVDIDKTDNIIVESEGYNFGDFNFDDNSNVELNDDYSDENEILSSNDFYEKTEELEIVNPFKGDEKLDETEEELKLGIEQNINEIKSIDENIVEVISDINELEESSDELNIDLEIDLDSNELIRESEVNQITEEFLPTLNQNYEFNFENAVPGILHITYNNKFQIDLPIDEDEISFADELDFLAQQITSAERPVKAFDEENIDDDYQYRSDVTSETLAKIYEMQGAYTEAIKAYDKLTEMFPDKADKYRKKIKKITQKLK